MRARHLRPQVELLEDRLVLTPSIPIPPPLPLPALTDRIVLPLPVDPGSDVPALSSRPGAPATVYLDFNGHDQPHWDGRGPIVSPRFTLDASPAFSAGEINAMRSIWEIVAEDYSPFNLNVTTVEPPADQLTNGRGVRVVVGGRNSDFPSDPLTGEPLAPDTAGVALGGSFSGAGENVAYVFSQSIFGSRISTVASHEAGHTFGLQHLPPVRIGDRLPLMSTSALPVTGDRFVWGAGLVFDPLRFQIDLDTIASNGFGFRIDDHPSLLGGSATDLTVVNNQFAATGVIEKETDQDLFRFSTGGGRARLFISGFSSEPNLAANIRLLTSSFGLVQQSNTGLGLPSEVQFDLVQFDLVLRPGTYYLAIASHGSRGDVGQYRITGQVNDGPRVVGVSSSFPTGIGRLQITFDVPIDPATFTVADLQFFRRTGGGGDVSVPSPISPTISSITASSGGRVFSIDVNLDPGNYEVRIGPDIADFHGNRMNQDGDAINGELVEDSYLAGFVVTLPAPSDLVTLLEPRR